MSPHIKQLPPKGYNRDIPFIKTIGDDHVKKNYSEAYDYCDIDIGLFFSICHSTWCCSSANATEHAANGTE